MRLGVSKICHLKYANCSIAPTTTKFPKKLHMRISLPSCVLLFSPTDMIYVYIKPLNAKLIRICHLLALLGTHHILHVGRIRVKS